MTDPLQRAGLRVAKSLLKRALKGKRGSSGSPGNKSLGSIKVNIKGSVDPQEVSRRLLVLGELVIIEIKKNIKQYRLISSVGGGAYLQGWFASVNGNQLTIENTQSYAAYIEYGTYAFGRQYDEGTWPDPPIKKMDMPPELTKAFPKGMAPFAPMRRVWYNEKLMKSLVARAFA